MNTIYDIDDEVLVKFKVVEVTQYSDKSIVYTLKGERKDDPQLVDKIYRNEDEIFGYGFNADREEPNGT